MKKIYQWIVELFEDPCCKKAVHKMLLKIEAENKDLPEMSILKLKREYLDRVDEILDTRLKLIEQGL